MIQKTNNREEEKKAAALKALDFVKEGMLIGLGTGSTVRYFIEALGEAVKKKKLHVAALATSISSEKLAQEYGILLLDAAKVDQLDLTVDGADEIDSKKRMIKGGGGALLREKITAKMSREMIVIVDAEKVVKHLGKHPLPLEILPWGQKATERELNELGFKGKFREKLSDNGNALFDIHFDKPLSNPEEIEAKLVEIPGVVTTGFFFGLATRVIVGYSADEVEIL